MKVFILLFSCLLASPVFAGSIKESEVPAKVKAYVTTHYPQATAIEWDYEKDEGVYEAEFRINRLEYKLEITPEGVLYASKEDLLVSALPASVTKYIETTYPGYKILGANKKVKGKKVIFDVGIKGKDTSGRSRYRNIYFDGEGNLLNTPGQK